VTGRAPGLIAVGLAAGAAAVAAVAPVPVVRAAPSVPLQVSVTPSRPHPGDVVLVRIVGADSTYRAEWSGRPLSLFPVRDGLAALVGIDLDTAPGPIRWRLRRPNGTSVPGPGAAGTVTVQARHFPTQTLTLPSGQVDLDAPTLARVEAEQQELRAVLADSAEARLWRRAFRVPVDGGRPTGGFGLRRIINGQPRSPHAGYDWAAPTGTPVLAANGGRVVLVAEHFFAGRNVVIDHGLGLFTLYFHLSEVRVAAGERVSEGQAIGAIGATGRVTGPHLHFAVILGAARVDPESLLALSPPPDAEP